MNMKLGGNFSGDVNLTLREEKVYTYGARTRFSGTKFPGTFTASSAVRSNTTEESVNIFKDLMNAYLKPISEEDLTFTKNVTLKSNALLLGKKFKSPAKLLEEYLDQYLNLFHQIL